MTALVGATAVYHLGACTREACASGCAKATTRDEHGRLPDDPTRRAEELLADLGPRTQTVEIEVRHVYRLTVEASRVAAVPRALAAFGHMSEAERDDLYVRTDEAGVITDQPQTFEVTRG